MTAAGIAAIAARIQALGGGHPIMYFTAPNAGGTRTCSLAGVGLVSERDYLAIVAACQCHRPNEVMTPAERSRARLHGRTDRY